MRGFIEQWDKRHIDGAELVAAVRRAFPGCDAHELQQALTAVARGRPTAASACAAAALCELAGLGDPLQTAERLYHDSAGPLAEPVWFGWIAGYSYNWICNGGLASCYSDFGPEQFADRIRVYEAIGASTAAEVMREADRAFGPQGPPPDADRRAAACTDAIRRRLDELNPRFWACGDEIFTRAFLYALEHRDHFS